MVRGVTRKEMRDIDLRASTDYAIPTLILMENAGIRTSDVVASECRSRSLSHVLVLCGRGNNGGDGFVVARHLLNAGLMVEVAYCGDPCRLEEPGDPRTNARILTHMGLPPKPLASVESLPLEASWLVVDAIFGTGLSGPVRSLEKEVIDRVNSAACPVVAVDIPSGLDADDGRVLGSAVRASITVTFALPKRGFFLCDGPAHVGRLIVADIGVPQALLEPFLTPAKSHS